MCAFWVGIFLVFGFAMVVLESAAGPGRDSELIAKRLGNELLRDLANRVERALVFGEALFVQFQ